MIIEQSSQKIIGNFFLKTYGCQMNEYDSQKMAKMMDNIGLKECDEVENADLIIINTCHIREKATEKLYSELGRMRKKKKNHARIVVTGCVPQAEGEEVLRRNDVVDLIVGPQSIHLLPDLAMKALSGEEFNKVNLDFPGMDKFDEIPESQYKNNIVANLTIQEGCDKFCKFCCVPYTRGAEYSRPVEKIYREALTLTTINNAKAIYLLGQNVNAYHGLDENGKDCNLGRLIIDYISKIPNLQRIFYTTSHPRDMHDELYEAHEKIDKLMPFVHLPIQSGSDAILKDMNRGHTAEEYLKIIDKLRKIKPDIQFSTDIIVGYPGETEEDFEQTYQLMKHISYAQSYLFKYSPRIGTPAANRKDQIPQNVVSERFQRLKALVDEQQAQLNHSMKGRMLNVLFERVNDNGQLVGRSQYMHLVFVNMNENLDRKNIGETHEVFITQAFGHSLLGELTKELCS
jgi:tRNA-2-methylthio-N6-dimethylallyladenosine synthase